MDYTDLKTDAKSGVVEDGGLDYVDLKEDRV
jgi:hypothetical protein